MFIRVLPIAASLLALAACNGTVPFCCAPSARVIPPTNGTPQPAPAVVAATTVTPSGYGALVNPLDLGDGKYVDDGGKYVAQLATFESFTGTHPSPFHIFVHYGDPFPTDSMNKIVAAGLLPMVTLYCDQSATLAQVLDGKDDAYFATWFKAGAEWGRPWIFRPFHEMNGANKTSCGTQGQGPLFVQVWHHIRVLATGAGMTNAAWVWAPSMQRAFADAYLPAPADFELVGGDHYAVSTAGVYEGPMSTSVVPGWFAHYRTLGKPMMITEFGVTQPYQAAYFADVATLLPKIGVTSAVYWDADGGSNAAHKNFKWSLGTAGAAAWRAMTVTIGVTGG